MKHFPRRQFLHLASGAFTLPAVFCTAWAQTYPTKPVRIIVGFAAGGTQDIAARLIGQWLSERTGQQFIVENRSGAAGNIAADAVVRAPGDGYTLLLAGLSNAANASLYDRLNFNFIRDIAPVAGIIRVPLILEVHPSFSAKTVPEFIAYAKANPGKINMASAGNGSPSHVTEELFKMMAGIDILHVHYRGSGPALTDVIGTGAGDVRPPPVVNRVHQVGYAPPTGRDDGDALGGSAKHSGRERICAGLRGKHMVRCRRAQEHTD
jgi:tripartite-type tricarboxylate transporter receptor subunit TctC